METLVVLLPWIQLGLGALMVIFILLQRSASGVGGIFGGGDFAVGNFTRRGPEKVLFDTTIAVSLLFVGSIILDLFI